MSRKYSIPLVLMLITLILYLQVGGFSFVNFDDPDYVSENASVLEGPGGGGISWAFRSMVVGTWQPVTWISLMLDAQLFGPGPAGFHLINLLLHILNTILLFSLLRLMTGDDWRAALVAALFALHPLHVESVAWITERKDVLSTLWGLLSLRFWVLWSRGRKTSLYLASALCLALGLMAKPMLITLPLVFLLLDYWPLGRWGTGNGNSPLKLLLEKAPLLLLSLVSIILTTIAQGKVAATAATSAITLELRLANAAVSYVRYLFKAFRPLELSVLYPHPDLPGGTPWAGWQIGGALLILGGISALVWILRRHRYLPVGWCWFLGTLVPVIGIVQTGTHAMADRFTYIPLVGLTLMLAWGGGDLVNWLSGRGVKLAAGIYTWTIVVILAILSLISHDRIGDWRDSITLGQSALAAGPVAPKTHYNLGLAYSEVGRYEEAVVQYRAAIRLRPDYLKALNNLGLAYQRSGRQEEAVTWFREALQVDPDHLLTNINLSQLLAEMGELERAIDYRRRAVRLDPGDPVSRNNLGVLLANNGQLEEAAGEFQRVLSRHPNFSEARRNLERIRELLAPPREGGNSQGSGP